ncbi:uncharacterized protein F5891DRAFT_1050417 [Suillus fuscotomentosus]|uniref:Uncharacterized protein n=1 Tax=Suillus fuscotomentosus TaxID=1912939 RepID=A0AAD4E052_9AGAM|nr:uncharacterized protein F5891DRAFT_1050417 [Suillus fuscotomentosus]KAG1897110.1 hypothetical protein F5891DRAFT_1050417 [Suillus fuscotomentosus]
MLLSLQAQRVAVGSSLLRWSSSAYTCGLNGRHLVYQMFGLLQKAIHVNYSGIQIQITNPALTHHNPLPYIRQTLPATVPDPLIPP